MRDLTGLMAEVAHHTHAGGEWCSIEKAQALAALIVSTRPRIVVEIGVWMGGSAIPMAMALAHVAHGTLIAIDPWDAAASVEGQADPDQKWWAGVDHERAFTTFCDRLRKHELATVCEVWRQRSDEVNVPSAMQLLHIDGNHAEQAIRDVSRFAPNVELGGYLALDDVEWIGGHVSRARELARTLGFDDLYALGTGVLMQKRR